MSTWELALAIAFIAGVILLFGGLLARALYFVHAEIDQAKKSGGEL